MLTCDFSLLEDESVPETWRGLNLVTEMHLPRPVELEGKCEEMVSEMVCASLAAGLAGGLAAATEEPKLTRWGDLFMPSD
eukprot:scaffold5939_cov165-Ochromonas_danica.AAC.7